MPPPNISNQTSTDHSLYQTAKALFLHTKKEKKSKSQTPTKMSGRLIGKTALVTGSSNGIGRAVAIALGKEGANVVVNYFSNPSNAEKVVQEIGSDRAIAVGGDATDIAGGKEIIAKTVQKFGKIDILVLCAGVLAQNGSLADTEEADFDRVYKANVKGPYFMAKVGIQKTRPLWDIC